jgi:hypothetical protein
MQINLGTSLSGLRHSSVPDDYTDTHPDSFTGTDGAISSKQFIFTDIPLGYLESITVTFTISGEIDGGSGEFQAPIIGSLKMTAPTNGSSYGQNALLRQMKTSSGSSTWLDSFKNHL